MLKVALTGNPNSGKSTLFNSLTGLNQKVGNYPGITVEKRTGITYLKNNIKTQVIDLPGAYSLFPKSIDERITQQILCNPNEQDYPDIVVVVADATNLRRSIFLLSQLIDMNVKTVLALNMVDVAIQKGSIISIDQLSEELGIDVVAINARKNQGIDTLKEKIIITNKNPVQSKNFLDVRKIFPNIIDAAKEWNTRENDYISFLLLCRQDLNCETKNRIGLDGLYKKFDFIPERAQAKETVRRYRCIDQIIEKAVKQELPKGRFLFTKRLDDILVHPIFGYAIFLSILFLIFQAIFSWSEYPMNIIDSLFSMFSYWVSEQIPQGLLNDLITKGVLAGLGGIMIFIPQIAFLFAFIALLEDTGYMHRISFMTDKFLRKTGLTGRSIIPLLSGTACAVPAIMSTRTIGSWKDRIITIMVTPLMSCAARLPVYALIISMIIPENKSLGYFNLQGLVMMSFYLIGFFAAIGVAIIMKNLIKSKEQSYYIFEMPSYKIPDWKSVFYTILEKTKIFLFEAGKVIIAVSIILWFLSSYGPSSKFNQINEYFTKNIKLVKKTKFSSYFFDSPSNLTNSKQEFYFDSGLVFSSGNEREEMLGVNLFQLQDSAYVIQSVIKDSISNLNYIYDSKKLEASYAGIIGKSIEPIIKPLGFDWRIGIALITSFAAREVFVGTMSTIYSIEDKNSHSIKERLMSVKNPETNKAFFTPAVGISLMLFYAFAMQCMSTLAIVYAETKNWKWPIIQFLYMGVLAYCSSFLAFQLLS